MFENIRQGRRLKKEDHIQGDLPFVMSGVTNTGLVGHIGNLGIEIFKENSITVDIFGNSFFRNYEFGAGDDVGVYRSNKITNSEALLFITASISRALAGKYSYGHKLRASKSYDIEVLLPSTKNQPDFAFMETFIRAIEKLAIADVVRWLDAQIEATKQVVFEK